HEALRRRRCDDDIRLHELRLELLERRGRRPEMRREVRRTLEAAVADTNRLRLLTERLRRRFRHLARADEENGSIGEIAEDATCKIDRDARDADRAGAELRLGTNALRDGERAADAAREMASKRTGLDRGVVRVFDLAEDLRLAEDHRVEARRDAED